MSVAAAEMVGSADDLFRLGINFSVGRTGRADLVEAHKWFNLAAQRGSRSAILHREEIASELSAGEIARALRAAREWIATH
ncbi:hypothetical protein [Propylenella binzhouense]|uniref:Sel1 repeat family protein n=1 Tax=Propylenella binzhouense TaxID=2555902 RepID=A0A964WUZ2_9HYPH|nr:hypothetical protein [Propylenella binzhouense]MYZ49596.1 hypothetical protein [Propylenella binzhouense]